MQQVIQVENVSKSFVLHNQGAAEIPVFSGVDFSVGAGECIALLGESGSGKSTFMRMLYANYLCTDGAIRMHHDGNWMDITEASPQAILDLRRRTLGYVSQFLRVIPRVPTIEIVAEPLITTGVDEAKAKNQAQELLARLRIPENLWALSPLTFSGGEQQRVNIARGFIYNYPILLLDEPTASLDAANRDTVIALINEAKDRGAGVVGIFHDQDARNAVCTGTFDITDCQVTPHE